jgi:hypothetical protein
MCCAMGFAVTGLRKLYPSRLVDEYCKALPGAYLAFDGEDSLRNPTAEEGRAFENSCSMRDMGTHLCAADRRALPEGPWSASAAPTPNPSAARSPAFRTMLHSHQRALTRARKHGEPAGQIAARELEIVRIQGALRRAEELTDDVAGAIEASARAETVPTNQARRR